MANSSQINGTCLKFPAQVCCGTLCCDPAIACCIAGVCNSIPACDPCSETFNKLTCFCEYRDNDCGTGVPCGNGCCSVGETCVSCGEDNNGAPVCAPPV